MTRLFYLFGLLALSLGACTSMTSLTPEQREAKEREKRMEAIRDSLEHEVAVKAIENMDFVLEVDKLIFKRGRIAYVSAITNFISAMNGRATVQVAPFNGGGPNGVGGITVEGTASGIKKTFDKRGNLNFSMNVTGVGISATVNIVLYAGSTRAQAVINPNFNSNRITLEGVVCPASESSVYKGRTL